VLAIAERFRDILVPFLFGGTVLLLLLLAVLVSQRLLRAAFETRHDRLLDKYRALVNAALGGATTDALPPLLTAPRRHRAAISELTLTALRIVRGADTDRARELAANIGLIDRWQMDLESSSWWRCAEATLALGLVRAPEAVPALIALLDDDHEQIRAAAIDALGQIGDPRAIAPLLTCLSTDRLHERTRIVEALRGTGAAASTALIAHGEQHPADRALVAGVIGFVGGADGAEPLLRWAADPDPALRAAAWQGLAHVGLDDRAFYHALKALGDDDPFVRADAAQALAKSGRGDAADHLAARLDDDWEVAAQAARALGRLGEAGRRALTARLERGPGIGQELARQLLWEGGQG
jgi:HEAT repeat protein